MKTPASQQARLLRAKLEELAKRGINGEKKAAKEKLRRLKRRFDWSTPDMEKRTDIFEGVFYKATSALPILTLSDFETLNAIKWAIEHTTGIVCIFKHDQLLANALPKSAKQLSKIAGQVAENFDALWRIFEAHTPNKSDKKLFIMGLFDGMMNDARKTGDPLPLRSDALRKVRISRRHGITHAPGVSVHPYAAAIKLGGQIRFCVPLDKISNELETTIQRQIA